MGLKLDKLRKNPVQFLSLTGFSSEDFKLLFILVYLKTFPLQELQAATFSMTQPQANFWIHRISAILQKTLKRLNELPGRNSQKLELLLKDCPDVLLDGVERNIQRPLGSEQQQDCYSGKKNA